MTTQADELMKLADDYAADYSNTFSDPKCRAALRSAIVEALGQQLSGDSGWLPIAEAPRDGTCVLVWPPTFDAVTSCAKWDLDKYAKRPRPYWSRIDAWQITTSRDNPPTHWMPLPAPPADALQQMEGER